MGMIREGGCVLGLDRCVAQKLNRKLPRRADAVRRHFSKVKSWPGLGPVRGLAGALKEGVEMDGVSTG